MSHQIVRENCQNLVVKLLLSLQNQLLMWIKQWD